MRNTASGSAARMYRWNDYILRSPIIKRILPDQKKICQIGEPRSADSMGYLRAGFQAGNTWNTSVQACGYQVINHLINGTPRWLDASTGNHDPELVWYQGAYATGAQTIQQGKWMSEAYTSFPGFHFTLPSMSSPWSIKEITVYYLNMGATLAYGPSIDGNANNTNIRNAIGDWGNCWVHFHVLNTPTCNYHPMDIINNSPYDTVDLSTVGSRGDFKGYRDLFLLAPMGVTDGCIPTLTNPVRQTYTMSATSMAHFTQNGAGWIVPTYHPYLNALNPSEDYRPKLIQNEQGTDNYWGSFSLRDVYIDVLFDIN